MFSNTDRFSEAARHFKEYGVYTKEPVGSKSWQLFWKQERDRCLNGLNLGFDKITPYHYNLLNYAPILKVVILNENENGQNQADRVKDFPNFLDGQYDAFWYFDECEKSGEHGMFLGSRGKGKSVMLASMGARNYHHIRDSKSYYIASRENYLLGDGILPKVWSILNHIDQNTPWSKRRHEKNADMHKRASVRITTADGVETIDPRSYNSEIIGLTVGDDVNKVRGLRGKLIVFEEFGSFKNGGKGWNICRPSMEDGKNTFGLMLGIGTGGDEGSSFEAMEELFYNTRAYNIHAITNTWEEGMEDTKCGFFYSADTNYGGATDKEGNSNREKARKFIEEDRKNVATASDPHALTRRKAEYPLTPREAMMKISGTLFPIDELKKQEAEIVAHPSIYRNADYIGRLELNKESQKYEFIYDEDTTVIYQFPLKDNKNLPGGICIYEHPKKSNAGSEYTHRYVAGCDSYDFDESTTTSLGSCFVIDLWSKRIVAEYTGRPKTADEFYENCRKLCLYYNATINIENANKGIFKHFDDKGCGYLLMEEPRVVRETLENASIKNNPSRRRRGTTPSKSINAHARGLLAKWFVTPTGNPEKFEEIHIHNFRSLPAIREALLWNSDGNFDRISALGMLMLAMEDREKYNEETTEDHKSLAQDDWFKRNSRRR
jgi:hypothetical protein